jgi:hypothetical protein
MGSRFAKGFCILRGGEYFLSLFPLFAMRHFGLSDPFQKPQNSDLMLCQGVLKLDGEFFVCISLTATLGLNYRYFFENLNSDFTSIHRS